MVTASPATDDPAMTTEQRTDPSGPNGPTRTTARPLRRRASDRVLGGVASGIADYLNVDPLLIRAAFVALVIFGSAGLVLYFGAWLLIPVEGEDESIGQGLVRRSGFSPGWGIAIAALIAVLVFWLILPHTEPGDVRVHVREGVNLLVLGLIVLAGIALLRRGGSDGGGSAAAIAPTVTTTDATTDTSGTTVVQRTAVVRRPPKPRGPLGWYTLAAALIGVGLLAVVDNVSDASVMPGQFFGLAFAIVGLGIIIGAWWGNARLLILPALLVLPVAWAASYVTVPLEGGTGDQVFTPVSSAELREEYRLVAGRLVLDLRDLDAGDEPVEITASVALGELIVIIPRDAQVEVDSEVGTGTSTFLGEWKSGTEISERYVRGDSGPTFILDLASGIGTIQVTDSSVNILD